MRWVLYTRVMSHHYWRRTFFPINLASLFNLQMSRQPAGVRYKEKKLQHKFGLYMTSQKQHNTMSLQVWLILY